MSITFNMLLQTIDGILDSAKDGAPFVIILRGLPGSGKSTLAGKLVEMYDNSHIFSADKYPGLYDAKGKLDTSKLPLAHGDCLAGFCASLHAGIDDILIVDNTNIETWEVAKYAELALAMGAKLLVVNVSCGDNLKALVRNVHNVPTAVFERMMGNLERAQMLPWWPTINYLSE